MKAAICAKYGTPDVFQIRDVEKPTPRHDEVCIKVHASAVTQSDIFVRSMALPLMYQFAMRLLLGIRKPRNPILGIVIAGVVESTGKDTSIYKPGDRIYGMTGIKFGAYAEYKCMKEKDTLAGCLSLMPQNMTFEEATATVYGGLLALQYLEQGNVEQAKRVLIYGASGTCGTIAVQLAKHFGAEVTGICSTRNLEMVKNLGADKVLDYTQTDVLDPGAEYDLVLDAVGKMKTSLLKKACKKAVATRGKYVSIDDGSMKMDAKRLSKISGMFEDGIFKSVIDRVYSLDQIVEAHEYVGMGHKKGGVVISIS